MNKIEKLLYTPTAAADALDVSRSLIYDLMKKGKLRWITVGADRRIPRSEVERIASEGVPAAKAA